MRSVLTMVEISKIKQYLSGDRTVIQFLSPGEKRYFLQKIVNYRIDGGKLYFRDEDGIREVIADNDEVELRRVLDELHLPNHAGMKGMYIRSKIKYVGFKRERINRYVSDCLVCKRHEPLPRIAPIIPIISEYPRNIVQMDCIDMSNYSTYNDGYNWILNIIDCHTKFLFSFPLLRKTGDNVYMSLKKVFRSEGAPLVIQSDNGLEFNNAQVREYLQSENVVFRREGRDTRKIRAR